MVDLDPAVVGTVLAMALVSYATKAGGMWVLDRVTLSERAEAGLEALPGGIIVAILAPRLLDGDPASWVGAAVVVAVAHRTDNVLLSLVAGFLVVVALRGDAFALL